MRGGPLCILAILVCAATIALPAHGQDKWPQPGGLGTPVTVTYSYSNLFDDGIQLGYDLTQYEMVLATEEALGLWASVVPISFYERGDSGPMPSEDEDNYSARNNPQIRIGHHPQPDNTAAHAYYPPSSPAASTGLQGDLHFDDEDRAWTERFFLYVATHELGHSIGLPHYDDATAVMNSTANPYRFSGLGGGFLDPPDIDAAEALYGAGSGRVVTKRVFNNNAGDQQWTTHENWEPEWMPTENSQVQIGSGHTVHVDTSVDATSVSLNSSTLRLGPSGSMTLRGGLAISGNSHWVSRLGRRGLGTVTADGAVRVAGSIEFPVDGTAPFRAGTYTLIHSTDTAGISGTFNALTDLGAYTAGDGLTYTAESITLTIDMDLHLGDADLDGVTDLSDFNIWNAWKFDSDTDWTTGDFNGDGQTDLSDFNLWNRLKFTQAQQKTVLFSHAIPEPTVIGLLACAVGTLLFLGRRPARTV